MHAQLFGLGGNGQQVYEWRGNTNQDLRQLARDMIKNTSHIHRVVAVQNVPNINQLDSSFHISYSTQFLFMEERQPTSDDEEEETE